MTQYSVGIDISKTHLDAHRLPDGVSMRFPNSNTGFGGLKSWLSTTATRRVIYEPTGPYHRAFEAALESCFPLVKVNPLQARRFAQACGTRAKTDAVDARLLAEMGVALALEPRVGGPENIRDLKELQVARQALIKDRTRLLNREKTLTLSLLKRQAKARLSQVSRQITKLDAEIAEKIGRNQQLARAHDILCSIPGLGQVSAAAVLIEMPELGAMTSKQTASLAGLAPMTRQSGQWRGKAFIQGGRKHLRNALYMPALVAARYNPDLKDKYNAMRAAGKPAKVALTALMRKLIELANTLIKADRKWVPKGA